MKVLFFSHSSALGGAERCYYESVIALTQQGIEVVCVLPDKGRLYCLLLDKGITVYIMKNPWWMVHWKTSFLSVLKNLYNLLVSSVKAIWLIRKVKPSAVVTNTMVIPSGAIAAKLCGIKHLWYIHEFGVEDHGFKMLYGRNNSFNMINYLSDIILVNSKVMKEFVKDKIKNKPIELLYYVVEIDRSLLSYVEANSGHVKNDDVLKILMPSRVSKNKRQIDAIDAVRILRNTGKSVELLILGDTNSSYSSFIKKFIFEHDLDSVITILPFVDEPLNYFLEADMILMCSTNEAFGRITIEAMKMGKCVIGANAGATAEIIEDGVTGFLFEPKQAEDLAQKIAYVANHKEVIAKVSKAGSKWAYDHCSSEVHGKEFAAYIYNS
jgi:glycosyltransferase involved in cell wall biosynthesis